MESTNTGTGVRSDPVQALVKCTEQIDGLSSLLRRHLHQQRQSSSPQSIPIPIDALLSATSDILSSHQLALATCRELLATVANVQQQNAQLHAELTKARFDTEHLHSLLATGEQPQPKQPGPSIPPQMTKSSRRPLKRARVLDSDSDSEEGEIHDEVARNRDAELIAPLPQPRLVSRIPMRQHAIPSRFRSLTTFARRRYMDGKFTISQPNTLVLAHSLAAPRGFDAADAELFTGKLCDAFRAHGELVRSIASLLIHAGSAASFTLADVAASVPKVKTRMEFDASVFAYLMRWTLRPLVVVRTLDKRVNGEILGQLMDGVAHGERYMIETAHLVLMAGIECDGYEDGLFEDSAFPPKGTARFRVRERYGLVAGDLAQQQQVILDGDEAIDELARGDGWDEELDGPNALPLPTHKLFPTLPQLENIAPPNHDIHLDIPAELIKSARSRNQTCKFRYEHGHLLTNQSSLRVLSHLLVPARALDPRAQQNYLAILNANASFKRKMSPAVVQALLPYGLGTPVAHEALRAKLAATDANYTFVYTWRAMLYSFVRPVLVLETATRDERPDVWRALRAQVEPGIDVPKDAHLALFLGVECVGMEAPTREAEVPPVGDRWYTLRERVGLVAKVKRQVGKRRRKATDGQEERAAGQQTAEGGGDQDEAGEDEDVDID